MKRIASMAALGAFLLPAAAEADCAAVSITEMNWASASVVTNVAAFLMQEGYGCDVTVVPSDTVPAVTSVAENNEPDIVTELWLNSAGDAYRRLEEQGQIQRVADVLDPGGVEGWWIPTYLADAHPELTTLEGVLANPELVGGLFHNCPDGWGCRVVNDNLDRAIDLEANGIKVFDHGSGETLATSMASAVQNEEPWFGYYWGPTVPLGKFDMTRVEIGSIDEEIHGRNQNQDTEEPGISDFPAAPILTAVTADFAEREPAIADLMSNMTFKTDTMSGILAWMDENGANSQEGAVYFLTNFTDEWSGWVNDEARENLSALLN